MDEAPLILTLALDSAALSRFDALRTRHFPPDRNQVPAHVTLFHALPGQQSHPIHTKLDGVCRSSPPLTVDVVGLRSLGRGVAYDLQSPQLAALRGCLAQSWREWLTPQDAQGYRPHMTIQNKARPEDARHLLDTMRAAFTRFTVTATGLTLWRYLGGPWSRVGDYPFGQ